MQIRYICVITATMTDQNNEFILWVHFLFGILVILSSVIEGPVQITERHINILLTYYKIMNPLLFKPIQLSMLCYLLKLLCKCAGKHAHLKHRHDFLLFLHRKTPSALEMQRGNIKLRHSCN